MTRHRVRILPLDVVIEVDDSESLMSAALRQHYSWPTVCQGQCDCATCWLVVESGVEHCSPMREDERHTLARGRTSTDPGVRLGCQLTVTGPVTVRRRGVRARSGSNRPLT